MAMTSVKILQKYEQEIAQYPIRSALKEKTLDKACKTKKW